MRLNFPAANFTDKKIFDSFVDNAQKQNNFDIRDIKSWAICSNELIPQRNIVNFLISKFSKLYELEKFVYVPSQSFDWDTCFEQSRNTSLFSKVKIIEIKLFEAKPGIKGAKAISKWIQEINNSCFLILQLPLPDFNFNKSSWFKLLERKGIVLTIPTPKNYEINNFIRTNLKLNNIQLSDDCIDTIALRCEGNISSAYQEIEKIKFIIEPYENTNSINKESIEKIVVQSSKYNPFDLPEILFVRKDKKKSVKIISSLHEEGYPFPLLLWILSQAVRKKINSINEETLILFHEIDKINKGILQGNPWIELKKFVLKI